MHYTAEISNQEDFEAFLKHYSQNVYNPINVPFGPRMIDVEDEKRKFQEDLKELFEGGIIDAYAIARVAFGIGEDFRELNDSIKDICKEYLKSLMKEEKAAELGLAKVKLDALVDLEYFMVDEDLNKDVINQMHGMIEELDTFETPYTNLKKDVKVLLDLETKISQPAHFGLTEKEVTELKQIHAEYSKLIEIQINNLGCDTVIKQALTEKGLFDSQPNVSNKMESIYCLNHILRAAKDIAFEQEQQADM